MNKLINTKLLHLIEPKRIINFLENYIFNYQVQLEVAIIILLHTVNTIKIHYFENKYKICIIYLINHCD